MAVINTNVKALFSQMALGATGRSQSVAMQQLSTGKRINSARDDAAGLAIATRMTHQIRSLNQAVRNAGDAINLIQTAEGATNEITDMLIRMRELAVQAVNDTNANEQRSYLDLEFQQLKQEIVRVADTTEWNGFPVLNGTAGERVGEMPVFKTTSVTLSDSDIISPTAPKSVEGTHVGERQKVTLDFTNFTTGTQTIYIGGVEIELTRGTNTDAQLMTKIYQTLRGSDAFDPNKIGPQISTSGNSVIIDYPTTQIDPTTQKPILDYDQVEVSGGGSFITNAVTDVYAAVSTVVEAFTSGGQYLKTGSLSVKVNDAGKVTASFKPTRGDEINLTVDTSQTDLTSGKIVFKASEGFNSLAFKGDLTYTFQDAKGNGLDLTGRVINETTAVQGTLPVLNTGDLQINGIDIDASTAADDKLSPPSNAAGSAIAKAAAINRKAADYGVSQGESQSITFTGNTTANGFITVGGVSVQVTAGTSPQQVASQVAAALKNSKEYGASTNRVVTYAAGSNVISIDFPVSEGDVAKTVVETGTTGLTKLVDTTRSYSTSVPGTGVWAKVNENVMAGQAMDASSIVSGSIVINGYATASINTTLNNARATRQDVIRAINMISDKTGVMAVDSGYDTKGVTLVARDGRNIEVSFDTSAANSLFGQRIGLREGAQASTISLESKVEAPVLLTSKTGNIQNAGFIQGNFTKNQSTFNTDVRQPVGAPQAQIESITIATPTNGSSLFSITINGQTYTSTSGKTKPEQIRDEFISLMQNDLSVQVLGGGSVDELRIVAKEPGKSFTLSTDKTNSADKITTKTIQANQPTQYKPLQEGDLEINGIKIPATTDDDFDLADINPSLSSSRSASAIAIAKAINSQSALTGVRAQANPAELNGSGIDTAYPKSNDYYTLFVNGVSVSVYLEKNEDPVKRLKNVADAINRQCNGSGVFAEVNRNQTGLDLTTDGRNLSVWYDSTIEGLSPASFGLDQGGDAKAQVSSISVNHAAAAGTDIFSFDVNGIVVNVPCSSVTDLPAKIAEVFNNLNNPELNNITAIKDPADPLKVLFKAGVPGVGFEIGNLRTANNSIADTFTLGLEQANNSGKNTVTGILNATAKSDTAMTTYGTVRMISDPALLPVGLPAPIGAPPSDQLAMLKATAGKPFTVTAGINGFGDLGNFNALGFQVGTYGGRSSEDLDPPRVGRMAFQVGASANQLITIDLADFGKGGPITGEITGDVDLNVEQRSVRINTREGASSVLSMLDTAMEKVNATRSTMGAVMNRLEHTISNLSNVSMNLEASRSTIEDADYAKASTELAKTQIMQQAATAVLAQANTSQQSVLKLLGG